MVKVPPAKAGDTEDVGSIPESGKIPWRREWQLTPVFLPREFHGQRSLAGYSSWGRKELDTIKWLSMYTCPGNEDGWSRVCVGVCVHAYICVLRSTEIEGM